MQKTKYYETTRKIDILKFSRKEQLIITRLRIGHTNLTHRYIMEKSTNYMRNVPNADISETHLNRMQKLHRRKEKSTEFQII